MSVELDSPDSDSVGERMGIGTGFDVWVFFAWKLVFEWTSRKITTLRIGINLEGRRAKKRRSGLGFGKATRKVTALRIGISLIFVFLPFKMFKFTYAFSLARRR